MNDCVFSTCRRYRYTLDHAWHDLLDTHAGYVAWIGLNPSTADEQQLDPTLRWVRSFTHRMGDRRFVMLNLFGLRATDSKVMLAASDPIGPDNDRWILDTCRHAAAVVCCWGSHGMHRDRAGRVLDLLAPVLPLLALKTTAGGQPGHPLYVSSGTAPRPFQPGAAVAVA